MNVLTSLPEWSYYLIQGVSISCLLVVSAIILGRAGRSPYWALLVIVPYVAIVAIWALAFVRWPSAPTGEGARAAAE